MDVMEIGRFSGALLLVVGLILAAGLAARRFGLPGLVKPSATRRLQIVESLMISPRQRLCILKRDGVEHLVVVGPEGATVIESGIAPPPEPAA
jgi:flagellar protein FliO/FliZ